MASWVDELSKLISNAVDNTDSNGSEAALMGGGAAAKLKAQAMADRKAADLARRAGESTKPTSQALTTRAGAGGAGTSNALQLTNQAGGGELAQRTGGELAKRTGGGEITEYEQRSMRNVTPQPKGAGIGSVTSGAAALNPVAATLAALAASTGTMGDATLPQNNFLNRLEEQLAAENAQKNLFSSTQDRLLAGVERDKASAPFMKEANAAAGPISAPEITDRKPVDITEGAPKATRVKEEAPMDMSKAEQLFKTTHGSAFDPKSSMDKRKMEQITGLLSKAGSDKLTPNQFALKIYRSQK